MDLEEARQLLVTGKYAEVAKAAEEAAGQNLPTDEWPILQTDALMAVGRYPDALTAVKQGLLRFPLSLRLRLLGYEVLRANGDLESAKALFDDLDQLAARREWAYREPSDRLAIGRAALIAGVDPKVVLDRFFDPVKKAKPDFRESYLASGELALAKNDFALAGRMFDQAAKKFPNDPDIQFGLARAFASSDAETTAEALAQTLKLNPNHTGARLHLADRAIDSEQYEQAGELISEALAINPALPEAHSLRAVLAHLRADAKAEKQARDAALKFWPTNPAVDCLIGTKLSRKYRFAESADRQRQALKFDPAYIPAKMQLAQDLLRLGQDDEGWKLVDEVQKADPYDVVAFNLTTLRDRIAKFQTLKSDHFLVRMDPQEAAIYGADALALLEKAHATLTKKYGLELKQQTIVEIFPDQKDFAIRTFGLPGGQGYLGVCFGRLITANSPAARPGSSANWQAILWHEFCHVVTLTLTKNKMPRWLSEGISVYEERQQRGNWGEKMQPRYRAMILGDDLTPVSQLSGAFLKPKTPAHLGFAYYESSLVVEYLIERFGLEKMKRVLADLARGVDVNDAIAAHAQPIAKIDAEFAERAKALAKAVGPALDWAKPKPKDVADDAVEDFVAKNPNNFEALLAQAMKRVKAKEWESAKSPLKKLIELYPEQHDADSAYSLLALAHRELKETDAELAVLNKIAELSPDAPDAFARLMELAKERKDWPEVLANAERFAAVNPLSALPHRADAEASEALGKKPRAIAAYRTVLKLDPENPADIHYRLARLLHETRDPAAKREVLLALEEAPRFREALKLLIEIDAAGGR
ncbi:MAG: tetratricopeptide repeat protein [Chthoniobacteraceae bacterium]